MATATNQHMTAVPASTSPSSLPDNGLLMKWATALLARFAVIWPKAWADSLAGLDIHMLTAEWAKGLEGLTGEEIRHGIDHCRANNTWPPSIAEFRTACRGGANAEQRAYAARARADQEGVKAIRNGTWGDTASVVAEHVKKVRADLSDRRATRCPRDIADGLWTREREEAYRRDAAFLGIKLKPIEWPDEVRI